MRNPSRRQLRLTGKGTAGLRGRQPRSSDRQGREGWPWALPAPQVFPRQETANYPQDQQEVLGPIKKNPSKGRIIANVGLSAMNNE